MAQQQQQQEQQPKQKLLSFPVSRRRLYRGHSFYQHQIPDMYGRDPKRQKRNKIDIVADILAVIARSSSHYDSHHYGDPRCTLPQLQRSYVGKLSSDQLTRYIPYLYQSNLINVFSPNQKERMKLAVTDKGRRFLEVYGNIIAMFSD